jgi:hypothetical protein
VSRISRAVRVLSFHADYACGHTGRCCSSNWPIPVEAKLVETVSQALDASRLVATTTAVPALDASRKGGIVLGRVHGHCVFHDTHASGGCRIQRVLGEAAIPLSCRQFPRQSVTDPRGTSVTLSHYCPTARHHLDRPAAPVTIVDHARAFPRHGEYVGLDASPDVPPLLHPRCLLDWESWWLIEQHAVTLVSEHPETALPRLAHMVETLHTWRPGTAPLTDAVHRAFDLAQIAQVDEWHPSPAEVESHVADVRQSVPAEWRDDVDRAMVAGTCELPLRVVGRFLAAHTFANWAAYNGRGLRTWYRSIEAAGCLLWVMRDPGMVDLALRHLADSSALITRWNQAERRPVIRRP